MLKDFTKFFAKYRERIFIGLAILCLIQLIVIIFLLSIDGSSKKIESLEIEKSISKEKIKTLESDLKTSKQIQDNYKQYYKNALQKIYEYEQAFQLIKSKNNEKIRTLPTLSDAELERFFAKQAKDWRLYEQTRSNSNSN
jgi:ABC-type dipeptide/oligopeptide/nickel transport system permease component